jgi:hypothetical protein
MNPSFPSSPWRQIQAHETLYPVPPLRNRLGKRQLPSNFTPDSTSIMCGRGKACTESPGNKRLKAIVKRHINDYSNTKNKAEKTDVVNMIMDAVQGENKEKAMFVRKHVTTWWEVDDTVAREKVGCMIRDALHTQYRSSSRAKFLVKKRKKKMALNEQGGKSKSSSSTSCSQEHKDPFQPNPLLFDDATNTGTMPSLPNGLFSLGATQTHGLSTNHPTSYLHQDAQPWDAISSMSSIHQTNMLSRRRLSIESLTPFQKGRIESGGPDDVRARRSAMEQLEMSTEKKRGSTKTREALGTIVSGTPMRWGEHTDPDNAGSSPDSSSWGIPGLPVVFGGDLLDDGNLPDDISSGIFD